MPGCNGVNYIRGDIFTRTNGKYPQAWIGEEVGVHNILEKAGYDKVYLCWRSAATSKDIPPDEEEWDMI